MKNFFKIIHNRSSVCQSANRTSPLSGWSTEDHTASIRQVWAYHTNFSMHKNMRQTVIVLYLFNKHEKWIIVCIVIQHMDFHRQSYQVLYIIHQSVQTVFCSPEDLLFLLHWIYVDANRLQKWRSFYIL